MNFIISKSCCFVEDKFGGFRKVASQLIMYRVVFCAMGCPAMQDKWSYILK